MVALMGKRTPRTQRVGETRTACPATVGLRYGGLRGAPQLSLAGAVYLIVGKLPNSILLI